MNIFTFNSHFIKKSEFTLLYTYIFDDYDRVTKQKTLKHPSTDRFCSTSKLVVEYVYNAFGKLIDILGEMNDTIGVKKPIRYKGYYYDSETQMYYCRSRYYNPNFCRWVSSDLELYIDTETSLGLNLFIVSNVQFSFMMILVMLRNG